MTNKTLGIGLLTAIGLAFLVGFFEEFMSYQMVGALEVLVGIVMLFFGIWGGIRLVK